MYKYILKMQKLILTVSEIIFYDIIFAIIFEK